jgi:hypothetical protein
MAISLNFILKVLNKGGMMLKKTSLILFNNKLNFQKNKLGNSKIKAAVGIAEIVARQTEMTLSRGIFNPSETARERI